MKNQTTNRSRFKKTLLSAIGLTLSLTQPAFGDSGLPHGVTESIRGTAEGTVLPPPSSPATVVAGAVAQQTGGPMPVHNVWTKVGHWAHGIEMVYSAYHLAHAAKHFSDDPDKARVQQAVRGGLASLKGGIDFCFDVMFAKLTKSEPMVRVTIQDPVQRKLCESLRAQLQRIENAKGAIRDQFKLSGGANEAGLALLQMGLCFIPGGLFVNGAIHAAGLFGLKIPNVDFTPHGAAVNRATNLNPREAFEQAFMGLQYEVTQAQRFANLALHRIPLSDYKDKWVLPNLNQKEAFRSYDITNFNDPYVLRCNVGNGFTKEVDSAYVKTWTRHGANNQTEYCIRLTLYGPPYVKGKQDFVPTAQFRVGPYEKCFSSNAGGELTDGGYVTNASYVNYFFQRAAARPADQLPFVMSDGPVDAGIVHDLINGMVRSYATGLAGRPFPTEPLTLANVPQGDRPWACVHQWR